VFRAACLLVLLAACTGDANLPPDVGLVREVVDGDTIVVRIAGGTETIRLIGVDTPETKHPTKPVECFGPEASARLASLLPRGTRVRLARDLEARDRFGRLLAHAYRLDDGLHVNLAMLEGGYGRLLMIEPNFSMRAALARAEDAARRARVGLWAACQR